MAKTGAERMRELRVRNSYSDSEDMIIINREFAQRLATLLKGKIESLQLEKLIKENKDIIKTNENYGTINRQYEN